MRSLDPEGTLGQSALNLKMVNSGVDGGIPQCGFQVCPISQTRSCKLDKTARLAMRASMEGRYQSNSNHKQRSLVTSVLRQLALGTHRSNQSRFIYAGRRRDSEAADTWPNTIAFVEPLEFDRSSASA